MYRVPVLSHGWCVSVHLAEQAVIIQLASKSSHTGIAQEMFWDIWNRTKSVNFLSRYPFVIFPLLWFPESLH